MGESAVDQTPSSGVDDLVFRNVVGHFASGVTVITTSESERLYGSTVSAVSSLSAEPPMMLICLNQKSSTHGGVVASKRFAINILSLGQEELAMKFASTKAGKFEGVDHTISALGVPLLRGALATIECLVEETVVGGTHTVFLGRVVSATSKDGEPLAYFRGKFGRLERMKENTAYAGVRKAVLSRQIPLGTLIDAEAMAAVLKVAPEDVNNAMIRLASEFLVERTDSGGYLPSPITVDVAVGFLEGRTTMEVGVIESHLARLTEEDADRLVELMEIILSTGASNNADLTTFLEITALYHERIMALARSPQLTTAYRQMSLSALWQEALSADEWSDWLGTTHLSELTQALVSRNADMAKEALLRHSDLVINVAKSVIERHGGAV